MFVRTLQRDSNLRVTRFRVLPPDSVNTPDTTSPGLAARFQKNRSAAIAGICVSVLNSEKLTI